MNSFALKKTGNSIEEFFPGACEENALLTRSLNADIIETANLALNDIIVPFRGFDAIDFTDGYDWEYRPHKNSVSCSLYLHALSVVDDLLVVYASRKELKYLEKAKFIIDSWIEYYESGKEIEMTWYDHPTGSRTRVISNFICYAFGILNFEFERYKKCLEKHAELMMDPSLYKKNNHGIMVDRGLMVLGILFNDKYIFDFARFRVVDTFWASFSAKAVHLENSPQYHSMVCNMYKNIEDYLNANEKSLGKEVIAHLNKASDYLPTLAGLDGTVPAIGDSSRFKAHIKERREDNFIDAEAGIAILKENLSVSGIYLVMVAGYSTTTHKHYDDLSIILSYFNDEILVDPGKFEYSRTDIRRYVLSARAHSCPRIEGINYEKPKNNKYTNQIGFNRVYYNSQLSVLDAHISSFANGSKIQRIVTKSRKQGWIAIIDKYEGTDCRFYKQNFNLNDDVKINYASNEQVELESAEGHRIVIRQWGDDLVTEIIEGGINPVQAVNTPRPGRYIPTKQVCFSNKSEAERFVMLTTIEFPGYKISEAFYEEASEILTITVNEDLVSYQI